jgi:hypothetical protein
MKIPNLLAGTVALLLAGCDRGNVTIQLTDAPVDDASFVQIQFDGVELIRADGGADRFDFRPTLQLSMLELQDGFTTALLDGAEVEDGDYTGIRLHLSADGDGEDSFLVDGDGAEQALLLTEPGAAKLEIDAPFHVERLENTELVLDFNLRASVRKASGSGEPLRLEPQLRLVVGQDTGQIAGDVDRSALSGDPDCTAGAAVYAYEGEDVSPADMTTAGVVNPVVTQVIGAGDSYGLFYLPEGDYTIALTCDALVDDPESDDTVVFFDARSVRVDAGRKTLSDF